MPLTPEQAAKRVADHDAKLVEKLVEDIDDHLARHFVGGEVRIVLGRKAEIRESVQGQLVKRFRDAGWRVQYDGVENCVMVLNPAA